MRLLLLLCVLLPATAAATPESHHAEVLTVDVVAGQPGIWAGKLVKVAGRFSAWQGKCVGRPPLKRSDWMLESDTACIYVSGRLPPPLSAAPPARGVGQTIVVTGKLFVDAAGAAYIESSEVRLR